METDQQIQKSKDTKKKTKLSIITPILEKIEVNNEPEGFTLSD